MWMLHLIVLSSIDVDYPKEEDHQRKCMKSAMIPKDATPNVINRYFQILEEEIDAVCIWRGVKCTGSVVTTIVLEMHKT